MLSSFPSFMNLWVSSNRCLFPHLVELYTTYNLEKSLELKKNKFFVAFHILFVPALSAHLQFSVSKWIVECNLKSVKWSMNLSRAKSRLNLLSTTFSLCKVKVYSRKRVNKILFVRHIQLAALRWGKWITCKKWDFYFLCVSPPSKYTDSLSLNLKSELSWAPISPDCFHSEWQQIQFFFTKKGCEHMSPRYKQNCQWKQNKNESSKASLL